MRSLVLEEKKGIDTATPSLDQGRVLHFGLETGLG